LYLKQKGPGCEAEKHAGIDVLAYATELENPEEHLAGRKWVRAKRSETMRRSLARRASRTKSGAVNPPSPPDTTSPAARRGFCI